MLHRTSCWWCDEFLIKVIFVFARAPRAKQARAGCGAGRRCVIENTEDVTQQRSVSAPLCCVTVAASLYIKTSILIWRRGDGVASASNYISGLFFQSVGVTNHNRSCIRLKSLTNRPVRNNARRALDILVCSLFFIFYDTKCSQKISNNFAILAIMQEY